MPTFSGFAARAQLVAILTQVINAQELAASSSSATCDDALRRFNSEDGPAPRQRSPQAAGVAATTLQ